MTSTIKPHQPLGIIGGGQLALMLANAARRIGLKPLIYAEDREAPAAQAHPDVLLGSAQDLDRLQTFFSQTQTVIFENEFLDCDILAQASRNHSVQFIPSLSAIARFQNKLYQKILLQELEIPSAEFLLLDSKKNISPQVEKILTNFGGSCVLKWARMGYDGKGVLVVEASPETRTLSPADWIRVEKFCQIAWSHPNSEIYVERKVPFIRELALVAVYSLQKEFRTYPLVISEQKNGICSRVYGPATAFGASVEQEKQAQEIAEKIARATDLYGAFAVEFFETMDGHLWVNEIAPRVHNSGHYTQNACPTDQFENHCRAALGLSLGSTRTTPAFAMLNLLGPSHPFQSSQVLTSQAPNLQDPLLPNPGPRSHLHWYGKKEIRPGRKVGHLNGTASSPTDLKSLLAELQQTHDLWVEIQKKEFT